MSVPGGAEGMLHLLNALTREPVNIVGSVNTIYRDRGKAVLNKLLHTWVMTELLIWGAAGLGLLVFLLPTGSRLPFIWVPIGVLRVGSVGNASP